MVQRSGLSGDALESMRTALAARDGELAAADRDLTEAVAEAHTIATEAIIRFDRLGAQIEAAVAGQLADGSAAAHELARFLVAKQREVATLVSGARAEIDAKTVALQHLTDRFRPPT